MQYGPYLEHETVTLRAGDDSAVIALVGAVVCDWQVADPNVDGQKLHLFDGYADDRELGIREGARGAIMVPFSNRIRDAKYVFDAAEYDFGPGPDGVRETLHGLVLDNIFEVATQTSDSVCLRTKVPPQPAYPWQLAVEVTYRLCAQPHRLELTVQVENLSAKAAPVAVGWHPYLNYVGGDWRGARVQIPAQFSINTDEKLIPLPGDKAFSEVKSPVVFQAPADLDTAFTGLVPDGDGVTRGRLFHPSGAVSTVEFRGHAGSRGVGVLHVFTGEPLPDRPKFSFAFEPCEFMTDQFNRPECADKVGLAPGGKHLFEAALEFSF